MTLPFFVYGTLLPNQPNFHLLQPVARQVLPATLRNGVLYDMGHFPMLVELPGNSVSGMLIVVDEARYAETVQLLDNLEEYDPHNPERSPYVRVKRKVVLPDNGERECWVYVGHERHVRGLEPIGGDWERYSQRTRSAMERWWYDYHQRSSASLLQDEDEWSESEY